MFRDRASGVRLSTILHSPSGSRIAFAGSRRNPIAAHFVELLLSQCGSRKDQMEPKLNICEITILSSKTEIDRRLE